MRKALLALVIAATAFAAEKPKVRAVTAFIRIDSVHMEQQYADAVEFIHKAADAYRAAGFEGESIRVETQPFPDYIRGKNMSKSNQILRKIDQMAGKSGFRASFGTAGPADFEVLA